MIYKGVNYPNEMYFYDASMHEFSGNGDKLHITKNLDVFRNMTFVEQLHPLSFIQLLEVQPDGLPSYGMEVYDEWLDHVC